MANVQIDNLASEVMKGLMEYKDLVTSDMKVAVRKAGRSVKKDIQANAPKKTGAYSKIGRSVQQKRLLNLWNLQYIPQRNISLHICLRKVMQKGAVEGQRQSHISHLLKKVLSSNWSLILKRQLEVHDG